MRTVIRHARIVDAQKQIEGDILIEGTRIVEVGRVTDRVGDQVIDAGGHAALPGFVNTHTHAAMTLFRGYADDLALDDWLKNKIWPLERHLTPEHVYAGTRLACLEMIQSGTIAFNDMYFFSDAAARAASAIGMRAAVSAVFFDVFLGQTLEQIEAGLVGLKKYPLVTPAVGPHAPYTVSLQGLKASATLAEKHNAPVHFHLAETESEVEAFRAKNGKSLIQALDEIGFLSSRLIAAHSVWLTPDEIRLLGARGVHVSHCPASNMKLAGGRALDYQTMRDCGVNMTLGTDGAASNNTLDLFEAMKLAALLQKHSSRDPRRLPAGEAFEMATIAGARALGLESGLIEPGRPADIALVDLSKVCFAPGHDLISDLVYSARGDCVDTVLIDGRIVMRDRHVPDEREIIQNAVAAARDLVKRIL